jgi:RNA polymerase sigma-70 factor (ECF subfamily)
MKSFFEACIWPRKGQLYRLVYLWVRDRALAEDLLQNVFEKSFKKENELKNHPNISGWLVQSLKNEVLMHFRKTNRLVSLDGLEELQSEELEPIDSDQAISKVLSLLKGIPLRQQEVFQLREVEGLTYEEIADYLEISLEQVKVNLHRARKKIQEKMSEPKDIK